MGIKYLLTYLLTRRYVNGVTFSINSVSLFFENFATCLGVTIDIDCKIDKQIHNLVAGAKHISPLIYQPHS